MITELDLQAAIAECQGEREPDSSTCIKLAAFYILQERLFPKPQSNQGLTPPTLVTDQSYSYSAPVTESHIEYNSGTDFGRMIYNRKAEEIWPIIDELMSTLKVVYPRLYDGVMRQVES